VTPTVEPVAAGAEPVIQTLLEPTAAGALSPVPVPPVVPDGGATVEPLVPVPVTVPVVPAPLPAPMPVARVPTEPGAAFGAPTPGVGAPCPTPGEPLPTPGEPTPPVPVLVVLVPVVPVVPVPVVLVLFGLLGLNGGWSGWTRPAAGWAVVVSTPGVTAAPAPVDVLVPVLVPSDELLLVLVPRDVFVPVLVPSEPVPVLAALVPAAGAAVDVFAPAAGVPAAGVPVAPGTTITAPLRPVFVPVPIPPMPL
jgi:hypothetical protein